MEVLIRDKKYKLVWDNRALFEYGKLSGLKSFNAIQSSFVEMQSYLQGQGEGDELQTFDRMVKMAYVSLKGGAETSGQSLDLTERDLFNEALSSPKILTDVFTLMLENSPKQRPEDKLDDSKKKD